MKRKTHLNTWFLLNAIFKESGSNTWTRAAIIYFFAFKAFGVYWAILGGQRSQVSPIQLVFLELYSFYHSTYTATHLNHSTVWFFFLLLQFSKRYSSKISFKKLIIKNLICYLLQIFAFSNPILELLLSFRTSTEQSQKQIYFFLLSKSHAQLYLKFTHLKTNGH